MAKTHNYLLDTVSDRPLRHSCTARLMGLVPHVLRTARFDDKRDVLSRAVAGARLLLRPA